MNGSALLLLALLAGATTVAWRRRVHLYAVGFGAAALVPGWAFVSSLAWPLALVAVAVALLVVWQRRSGWAGSPRRSRSTP